MVSFDRWRGKVAIVTGASAGIGAAIAEKLVEEGLQVVGLARRFERMEELAEKLSGNRGKLYGVQCDLSNEEDILRAFKWTEQNVGPVHILVNNAGILDLNVLGLCIATRETIKHNVLPIPRVNVYTALKFAVTALAESLRQELDQQNLKIKITSISPGYVDTQIREANSIEVPEVEKKFPMLQTEDIAEAILYVLSTPPHVQVHELTIKPVGEVF